MKKAISNFFLNEAIINTAIILNITMIILEQYNIVHPAISAVGYATLLFFIGEMACKQAKIGIKEYWRSSWNRLDGALVILSLPTFANLFFPSLFTNSNIILTLRIFRVFRFFRLTHFFPHFDDIANNFKKAMRDSRAVLLGYMVVILICSLISCSLFCNISPEYFGTPGKSIYSTFRLFTIEGWYDIPDTVTAQMPVTLTILTKLYFCITLLMGGIIGLSLLNSIFVDAMVSDNNNEIVDKIDKLQKTIDKLQKEIENKK